LQTSHYAYLDVRLTGLGAQLEVEKDARERYVMLYSRLSELVDFFPDSVRPFLEWWIMKNDFENIKDVLAQMLGALKYEIWRPSVRVPKDELVDFVQGHEVGGLLDFLSASLEDFDRNDFEGLGNYQDLAYRLDKFYYGSFASKIPSKPDDELAWKLVHVVVDAKNANLVGRTVSPDKFYLPYGLLEANDLSNLKRLQEALTDRYNVRNRKELLGILRDACNDYNSDFARTIGFITYQEHLLEMVQKVEGQSPG
jgi:hypothetical protein